MSAAPVPRVSVITPTYNRAYALERVMESLEAQTLRTDADGSPLFEWIVLDDGSTDDTRELIEGFKARADFPIRYRRQANRGKAGALNAAFAMARGELSIIADSDDRFVPETMETFLRYWDSDLRREAGEDLVSILCRVRDGYSDRIITHLPAGLPLISEPNYLEYRYRHGISGEGWAMGRTEVYRNNPFPEIPGGKFVPEDYVWNDISRRTRSLLIEDVLRIALFEQDGYSRHPALGLIRQPLGPALYFQKQLNDFSGLLLRYVPLEFIKSHLQLARLGRHAGRSFLETLRELGGAGNRLLFTLLYPAGRAFALYDRWRFRRELAGTITGGPADS